MVNNLNPRILDRSKYQLVKSDDRTRLKRRTGPIYDLGIVKQLLNPHWVDVVNANAIIAMDTMFVPPLTEQELVEIILALDFDKHYVESEICKTSTAGVVDADAYKIHWNRNRKTECKLTGRPIYVKFGFLDGNPQCKIVSSKPSKY